MCQMKNLCQSKEKYCNHCRALNRFFIKMHKVEVSNKIEIIDTYNVKNIPVRNQVLFDSSTKICTDQLLAVETIPLAAATIGLNNTVIPIDIHNKFPHFWTEIDVQEHFLKSKPTCYLIIGQPGVGLFSLGEAMEEKYKCIHICPLNVIRDEQLLNTDTWKTINFNLRQNRVLSCDYILEMIKTKLMSPAVFHRGYVISGLPLISSSKATTQSLPKMYSEEAVLLAQNILEKLLNDAIKQFVTNLAIRKSLSSDEVKEENIADGQEIVLEGPQEPESYETVFHPCQNIILKRETDVTVSSIIMSQSVKLFQLQINADFVIYANCPYKDLVCKRKHKYFNYMNSTSLVLPFSIDLTISDIRWSPEYIMSELPSDNKTNVLFDIDHIAKYNCRYPINFTKKILSQISNYKELSLPILENELLNYNSNFVFKLDGRVPLTKSIYTIQEKLILMLIKPVLIPSPLPEFESYHFDVEAELDSDLTEFWSMVINLNLTQSGNLKFNLRPSAWFNRCPVELKYGRVVIGKVKYAVLLFNNVYLLSSRQAYADFLKNPRPFLKLKYLQPSCRIAILGSKSSGKSMTAECLAWLLDGQVIDYNKLYDIKCNKKRISFYEKVLLELAPQIEEARLEEWSTLESERKNNLNQWLEENYNYVKTFKLTNFKRSNHIESTLRFSFLTDVEEIERVLANRSIMLKYAPDELLSPIIKPGACTIEHEDAKHAVIKYINENNLQGELELSPKELVFELSQRISDIEKETEEMTNGEKRYGNWIIDGAPGSPEIWNEMIQSNLLPDYVITIIETREVEKENLEILSAYRNIGNSKKIHRERFMLANDTLLSTKLLIKPPPPPLDSIRECNKLIDDIIRDSILNSKSKESNETDNLIEEEIDFYNQAFTNFKEQWDGVKALLDGVKKSYIEVEIAEKSDIQIIEDILLNLRKLYNISCTENNEDNDREMELEELKNNRFLGETGPYCPVEFFENNIIWNGSPDYTLKYNNKIYNFSTEQNMLKFKKDPTIMQDWCHPFKKLPPLRICITGCSGSGRSTVCKQLSKELGLLHIDFSLIVNYLLIPPHCKKVGRQFENIFLDIPFDDEPPPEYEEETENEFLENITEENIRKIVYNYFENNAPMPKPLLRKVITKIWFEEPYIRNGFVLDGFPRLPSDLEEMLLCHIRPDIILLLDLELDDCLNRLAANSFSVWKKQLKLAKINSNDKYEDAREKWLNIVTKLTVVKLICNEIEKNVFNFFEDLNEHIPSEHSELTESHSSRLLNVDEDLFNVYNDIIQEFPEPVNEDEWENEDDAKNRIEQRIEHLYGNESSSLESLRDLMSEQRLLFVNIDASKSEGKVLNSCLLSVSSIRTRTESFFEQTFPITLDQAEILLTSGHYFLSKYIRQCPVFIYKNSNTLFNIYKSSCAQNTCYPIIHRCYIYFLGSKSYKDDFCKNPLRFITNDSIEQFISFPLRVGIIGAPKSGKSSLTARLASNYRFIPISRGSAIRYVLEDMGWTNLAKKMRKALISGNSLHTELIMECIQIAAVDHRAWTQGIVFDGFPNTVSEAMCLSKFDLYPFVIFDLMSGENVMDDHILKDEIYKGTTCDLPPFSRLYHVQRFSAWQKTSSDIRKWIDDDYQNLYKINPEESRWKCYIKAKNIIEKIETKIHTYLVDVMNKAVSLEYMCISNENFTKRSSHFKNYCPVCLREGILKHSNFPVDRCGFIQYKNYFYWGCLKHRGKIMINPNIYLIENNAIIPTQFPVHVKYFHHIHVYENGICMVTYAENLPALKIIQGDIKYAANYMGKVYLHCSEDCLKKFMEAPHNFYQVVTSNWINSVPNVSLKSLPYIGYLEQTLGNIITDACCQANILRPKYPGLSVDVSGLLLIALYLKQRNPLTKQDQLNPYYYVNKKFEARCKVAVRIGKLLRSTNNPFADRYPACCHKLSSSDYDTVIKPSSVTCSTISLLLEEASEYLG